MDITAPPITDKTGQKILQTLKSISIYPDVNLSISNNRLDMTFSVYDYDPNDLEGYEVGDVCLVSGVMKVCIQDTSGVYDLTCWENYFEDYDSTRKYLPDDMCMYSGVQKICIAKTTGTYDPNCWIDF